MKGYKFKRQRPVLNYIADFNCLDLKLIIEADGITHDNEEGYKRDQKRDEILTQAGFHILRFQDEDIMKDLNSVQRAIEGWIEEFENGAL
jgi:very-short-patch-repair endonuclease